jgi:hypothetical protein
MGNRQAVIQASLGGLDNLPQHVPQTLAYDYHLFTDENFPPRHKVMLPRLQAKIPKMFAWQMVPDYDYYLWLDGNLILNDPNTLQYFHDQIQGYDIVGLKHPRMPNVHQEIRYLRKGLREQSRYLVARYDGEFLKEQTVEIEGDKDWVDDLMIIGGIFMYRNTFQVQEMMKQWWYHVSRYNVQDQISFSYCLRKARLKVKVLDYKYDEWEYIKHVGHAKRYV